ncbi:MAG: OmcA/MtrC family decaheme c-type cytochrome, partial [Thermoanaerobaculia bacterium]
MSLVSRTALTFLAGLVAVPMTPVTHTSSSAGPVAREAAPVAYTAAEKEFFLAPDQLTYIRPGLNMKIASVTNVAPGQKPVVEFYLTDDLTGPLDRYGILTPGVVTPRFIIGMWNPSTRRYINVVGTSGTGSDRTGTFQDLETGHYKYTFFNALAANYDPTQATTLAVFGSRNTTDIVGKNYYAMPQYKDFIASTGAAATTFNATTIAKCNQCHDPLAPHGGNYRDIKQCVLCHNPNGMKGAAAPFDGQIFFHALHQGKNATVGAITYPQDIRFCTTCHDATAAGGGSWYTYPSIAACGSCHDDVNFVTGANHNPGPAADGTCANCHTPQGSVEWDAGIKNAHIVPLLSSQLKGYTAKILSVTNAGPGKKITVTFQLANGDGSFVDPGVYKDSTKGSLSIKLGGPTTDYTNPGMNAGGQPISEAAQTATYNATTGQAVYTFTNAIPAAAKGTYVVSIETRRPYTLNPAPTKGPTSVNEGAPNVPFYFGVTDTTPVPRRTLVSLAKCNVCHARLDILFSHGNQRIDTQHCPICHNPNGDDSPVRPTTAPQPPESISFARMIHRIHSGDTLAQDYTIYGFGGAISTFNDVTYPGDRRNCVACHTSAAVVELPLPITNVPVISGRDFFSPRGSATAACTGCHDSRDVAAHAFINTAYFPNNPNVPAEACGTCHGAGADLDVAKVH